MAVAAAGETCAAATAMRVPTATSGFMTLLEAGRRYKAVQRRMLSCTVQYMPVKKLAPVGRFSTWMDSDSNFKSVRTGGKGARQRTLAQCWGLKGSPVAEM